MTISNAERQRKWRKDQKAMGHKPVTFWTTKKEREYLEAVFRHMRDFEEYPAQMRNRRGQMKTLDM